MLRYLFWLQRRVCRFNPQHRPIVPLLSSKLGAYHHHLIGWFCSRIEVRWKNVFLLVTSVPTLQCTTDNGKVPSKGLASSRRGKKQRYATNELWLAKFDPFKTLFLFKKPLYHDQDGLSPFLCGCIRNASTVTPAQLHLCKQPHPLRFEVLLLCIDRCKLAGFLHFPQRATCP